MTAPARRLTSLLPTAAISRLLKGTRSPILSRPLLARDLLRLSPFQPLVFPPELQHLMQLQFPVSHPVLAPSIPLLLLPHGRYLRHHCNRYRRRHYQNYKLRPDRQCDGRNTIINLHSHSTPTTVKPEGTITISRTARRIQAMGVREQKCANKEHPRPVHLI